MKSLLILTASKSLPRPEPEVVYYDQTWPSLFENEFKVHQCSKGGATSEDICNISWYGKMYRSDIVVLESGLVDCAPRAFSMAEIIAFNYFLITRYPYKVLNKFFSKHIRRIRRKCNVSLSDYRTNIEKTKANFERAEAVYVLGAVANAQIETINKGCMTNITRYNEVLKSIFGNNYISVDDIPNDYLMSDYCHLNEKGHQFIHDRIREFLKRDNLV